MIDTETGGRSRSTSRQKLLPRLLSFLGRRGLFHGGGCQSSQFSLGIAVGQFFQELPRSSGRVELTQQCNGSSDSEEEHHRFVFFGQLACQGLSLGGALFLGGLAFRDTIQIDHFGDRS